MKQSDPIEMVDLLCDAFPQLNVKQRRPTLKLYQLLAQGVPVPCSRLAEAVDKSLESVSEKLGSWPGVFTNEADEIIGFWGLSVEKTGHQLTLNGRSAYAWCAWDTLFLPELLNATVTIDSTCAASGDPIRLIASKAGVQTIGPSEVVLSFLIPDATEMVEDVTTNFCHFGHFFRSQEDGAEWVSKHEGTFVLSLDDAFQLGKTVNAIRYGEDLLGRS